MSNGLTSNSSLDLSANILSQDCPMSLKPIRPAPKVPPSQSSSNYSSLSSYQSNAKLYFSKNHCFNL